MLDSIRKILMIKFAENKEMSRSWNSVLCPTFEKKLAANMESCRIMKLIRSSNVLFKVLLKDKTFRVDISRISCSCNLWNIVAFPCSHTLACISSVEGF